MYDCQERFQKRLFSVLIYLATNYCYVLSTQAFVRYSHFLNRFLDHSCFHSCHRLSKSVTTGEVFVTIPETSEKETTNWN